MKETARTFIFHDKANKRYLPASTQLGGCVRSNLPAPIVILEDCSAAGVAKSFEDIITPDGWIPDGPEFQAFLNAWFRHSTPTNVTSELKETLQAAGIGEPVLQPLTKPLPQKPGLLKRILSFFKR